ncbi:MAG TPA: FtsQ-type POTRA domain-containing protein [Longimicrobiales bacterium]
MKARVRWAILGVGAAVMTSAAAGAPSVLRRMDSFAVHRVEIRGTHMMAAYAALKQSGITRKSSVFDDFAPWRARLLKHPMVLDATIERRLPSTIRITITETSPVALARTPDLTPVDARGRALPVDPATVDLDVPVLAMTSHPDAAGRFVDSATISTVRILAALERRDARLFSWVSEAGALRGDGVRLGLRSPAGAEAFVASDPRALRLNELQVALADLAARGELSRLERIDARFHDQIVVALKNGK